MNARRAFFLVIAALALLGSMRTSHAELNAVDPGPYAVATGNYPLWYQDTTGRPLELCLSATVGAHGAMCLLLAVPGIFDPAQPMVFPSNFPDESFWFAADAALIDSTAGINLRYVAALEAAFANGDPLDGDQVAFARIRIRVDVSTPGTYIITHPYGVETFENVTGANKRDINFTSDIGVAPGNFMLAFNGAIGPFLQASGGPIMIGGETFVGDPNIDQTVTGSPFGTNYVRVQGPGGIDVQTDLFTLAGKIYTGNTPTPLVVERTTYSRTATETQIDAFAASPALATVSFAPPPATPLNGDSTGHFFGQVVQTPATDPILSPVTVSADNSAIIPGNTLTSLDSAVTDVVSITKAVYDPSVGTLLIEATSSDETAPLPTLTAEGLGLLSLVGPGPMQRLVVAPIIPPATVTVTSGASGADTEEVVILP